MNESKRRDAQEGGDLSVLSTPADMERLGKLETNFAQSKSPLLARQFYQRIEEECPGFWQSTGSRTRLHIAIRHQAAYGRVDVLHYLVCDLGLDVNDTPKYCMGDHPLLGAIDHGHEEAAFFLIDVAHADTKHTSMEGQHWYSLNRRKWSI